MNVNTKMYINDNIDYKTYLIKEIDRVSKKGRNNSNDEEYSTILENVPSLGPQNEELFDEISSRLGNGEGIYFILLDLINSGYGEGYYYSKNKHPEDDEGWDGGYRRNKASPKHDEMTMKDIKEMCKANEIKLSKVVEGKRVAFKKKELITKLKRKKLL